MDDTKRMKRRFFLAGVGAISGLFSAVGGAIILTQGGHISTDLEFSLPIMGIIIGAAVGFLDLTKTGERTVTVGVAAATVVIAVFAVAPPAANAQEMCTASVTVGTTTTDLSTTSEKDPLFIDLNTTEKPIIFEATADGVERGTVKASVVSFKPYDRFYRLEPGASVVYFGNIYNDHSLSILGIDRSGPTGFVVTGPSYSTQIPSLGLFELDVIVTDLTWGQPVQRCSGTAWIRLVAQPISTPTWPLGAALATLGLAGFGTLQGLKNKMNPRPSLVKAPSDGPWIPSHGMPHAPQVESRLLDARSRPVALDAPLVEGRQYRLELTINPGEREKKKDEEGSDRHDMTVSGQSEGIDVEPFFQFGFSGTPLSIEVPIFPRRQGHQEIVMDVTSNGHLLQTNRLTVAVGAKEQEPTEQAQTTRTVFSASDLSAEDLSQRKPRKLLVILEADDDGSVDARLSDEDGEPVAKFDSRLQAEAITKTANDMRTRLVEELERGPGMARPISREQLESMLVPLVKAGRQMHMALFPRGSVVEGEVANVSSLITDGATVQVIQTKAGLGHSTLPWNLVYDHPFQPHTKRNRLCPQFPEHPVDKCPNEDDHEVMCPSGFWGYRAIVEEPFVSAGTAVLTPPVGLSGTDAVGYLDAELSDSERQAEALGELGMERLGDFDGLLDVLRDQSRKIGVMYFYAHHDRDFDIDTQGIAIDDELLSSLTFDSLDVEWSGHPLIFVNGCASGDYAPTDPLSLLEEFRQAGAVGAITSECALWDPLAGSLGEQILDALADGHELGPILRDLRRQLLISNNNMLGFVYRLQALSETTARFEPHPAETIEIDLTAAEEPAVLSEDEAT